MKCADGPCPYPATRDGFCAWHRLLRFGTSYELNAVRRRLRRVLPKMDDGGRGPTIKKMLTGKFSVSWRATRFTVRRTHD